jgi:hypothetical protein
MRDMDRTQLTGVLIMVGTAVELVLFVIGVMRRSYLAIALPVMGAMAALSALAVWIGWTMFTTEAELPEPEFEEEETSPQQ